LGKLGSVRKVSGGELMAEGRSSKEIRRATVTEKSVK